MSTALDQIVNVNISQQTQAVQQASFSIPAIFGPSNRFAPVTPTGTTVSGSNKITALSSMTGVIAGAYITGTGIPANSFIQSVSNNVAYLNNNASASGTVTLTITDAIRAYTSLAGMTADGFLTTDPEYIRASELLEQPISPPIFYVGSYGTPVEQVTTITPTAVNSTDYIVTINGTPYSYESDSSATVSEIVAGLLALINADPAAPCVATGSTTLILTALVAGAGFTVTLNANMTQAPTTLNYSIVQGIQQAQVENDSWYGVSICSNADGDIEQVAAYIETQIKIFLGVSNDAAIATAATTDLGSILKGLAYARTGLIFALASIAEGIEAAWLGGQLPQVPGSNNWAFQTLEGISPDTLSANQQSNLIGVPEAGIKGKNVNIYQTVGGVNITQMGTMAGGQYIDITIGVDWLRSTIQTNLFQALVSASKIPYTDNGVAILISAVKSAIDQGVANGLIDGSSPIIVTAPLVATVSPTLRANRIAPTITFTCRLQGAFNAVIVNGTVTV